MKSTKIIYKNEEAKQEQDALKKLIVEMVMEERTYISDMKISPPPLDENSYTRDVVITITLIDEE